MRTIDRYVVALTLAAGFAGAVLAQESVTLPAPALAQAGVTVLRPAVMSLNNVAATITVQLLPWTGAAYVQNGQAIECVRK